MRLAATKLIDLFFPQLCLLCGESLLLNRSAHPWGALPVCPECLGLLRPIEGRRCAVCGLPLISELEVCTRCRTNEFPFVSNRSLYEYGGPARDLIGQYKFRGERSLAVLFADRLAGALREWYPGVPVAPVPSRPRVIRKRGWDHVGTVVDLLARVHQIEVRHLLRRDNGRSQKSLDFANRLTNLRGQIHWAASPRDRRRIPGRLVLFDDVFTTGATAAECSRVLIDGGVPEINVVTLAVD